MIKPGDKIIFTDVYRSPNGDNMGKEYYNGTIKSLLNTDIFSVIFTHMSFDGIRYFETGNTYTTANLKDIIEVI